MKDEILRKLETLEIPAGYTVGATVITIPIWVEPLTVWLQLFVVVVGIMVGLTTIWLNIKKIRQK